MKNLILFSVFNDVLSQSKWFSVNLGIEINNSSLPKKKLLSINLLPSEFLSNLILKFPTFESDSLFHIQFIKFQLLNKFRLNLLKKLETITDNDIISKLKFMFKIKNDDIIYELVQILSLKSAVHYEYILLQILVKNCNNRLIKKKENFKFLMQNMLHLLFISNRTNKRNYLLPRLGFTVIDYLTINQIMSISDEIYKHRYLVTYLDKSADEIQNIMLEYKYFYFIEIPLHLNIIFNDAYIIEKDDISVQVNRNWVFRKQLLSLTLNRLSDVLIILLASLDELFNLYNITYQTYIEDYNLILYNSLKLCAIDLNNAKLKRQIKKISLRLANEDHSITFIIKTLVNESDKDFKGNLLWEI